MRDHPVLKLTCPKTKRTVYVGWSSVCDAQVSAFLSIEDVSAYWHEELRKELQFSVPTREPSQDMLREADFDMEYKVGKLQRRLARLEKNGHTLLYDIGDPNDYVKFNRAGPNEKQLTLPKLVDMLIDELAREGK